MTIWNITYWNTIVDLFMNKVIYSKGHACIVEQLKRAREEAGLGQQEVAKLIGSTQSHISKVETSQRRIDVIMLKKFAQIYRKPISYFLK